MVLNQGLIPESSVDVAINESVYELHFKVEHERNNSRPISMDMDDAQTNNGAANGYEKDDERRRVRLVPVTEILTGAASVSTGSRSVLHARTELA
jgi:hypothetical protein